MTRIPFFFLLIFSGIALSFCKHSPDAYNPDSPPPPPPTVHCNPDTIYFTNDVLPLITSNCAKSGCHDVQSHQHGVTLTEYSSIIYTAGVTAYYPLNSKIYQVIIRAEDLMPPPPSPALSSDQVNQVYKWISQGAKNNQCISSGCDSVNVGYFLIIKPLFAKACVGCHNNAFPSGGIQLADYDGSKSAGQAGRLMGAVKWTTGFSPMPKGGNKLTNCEITQLQKWISNQYPQ